MSLQDLGAVGELIGGISVVISLVYLAVQIRQNTQTVRASAYQSILAAAVQARLTVAQDPVLCRRMLDGLHESEKLTDDEKAQLRQTISAMLRLFENVFFQYRRSMVEEAIWESWRLTTIAMFSRPDVQEWWPSTREFFHEEFREFLEREATQPTPPAAL